LAHKKPKILLVKDLKEKPTQEEIEILRAVTEIWFKHPERGASVKELARKFGIPEEKMLSKLNRMKKKGLLIREEIG
jgi:DNA-binding IclR family transcriptional regulator